MCSSEKEICSLCSDTKEEYIIHLCLINRTKDNLTLNSIIDIINKFKLNKYG